MALVRQSFNLVGNIVKSYNTKQEYEYLKTYEGFDEFASNYEGDDVYGAYNQALRSKNRAYQQSLSVSGRSAKTYGISVAAFLYNYSAATTRFGLRGQDIQDQLKIQDRLVNKAFGVVGTLIAAGPQAAAGALVVGLFDELIKTSKQNAAYEYRKQIDEQQKSIMQERVGRAVYNSSRRA